MDQRIKQLFRIINLPNEAPEKRITMEPNTWKERELGTRRVGRPRLNWFKYTKEEVAHQVRIKNTEFRDKEFEQLKRSVYVDFQIIIGTKI